MTGALEADAIEAVITAALECRGVVVSHSLPPDSAPTDAELDDLAERSPALWVRTVDGDISHLNGQPPAKLETILPHHLSEPTVSRIYHLQRSPRFRSLTDAVFDPLEALWPASEPWLERDAGFFISSRDAFTPAHSDRHHNLLVQLSGTKRVSFVRPGSTGHAKAIASSPTMWIDGEAADAETVDLTPGNALYLPPFSIHWVHNYERTVAVSCAWRSPATVRAGELYAANAALARAGIPVRPLGGRTDGARLKAASAVRRISVRHHA